MPRPFTEQKRETDDDYQEKLPAHQKGSGNIFADLGLTDAEEHQLKAVLVVQLKRLIAERKLTQTDAKVTAGLSPREIH